MSRDRDPYAKYKSRPKVAKFWWFSGAGVSWYKNFQFLLQKAHPCPNPRRLSHFARRSVEGSDPQGFPWKKAESDVSPLTQGCSERWGCCLFLPAVGENKDLYYAKTYITVFCYFICVMKTFTLPGSVDRFCSEMEINIAVFRGLLTCVFRICCVKQQPGVHLWVSKDEMRRNCCWLGHDRDFNSRPKIRMWLRFVHKMIGFTLRRNVLLIFITARCTTMQSAACYHLSSVRPSVRLTLVHRAVIFTISQLSCLVCGWTFYIFGGCNTQ